MNKEEFKQYIEENFDISGESKRLISNILDFVELRYTKENEQCNALCELLYVTINEIKQI